MTAPRIGVVLATTALAAIALGAMWLVALPAIAAADEPQLGLTPMGQPGTYFDLTLGPGEHRRLEVEAANFGPRRERARTYAADVYSIVNGGFGAELHGQQPSGPTTWLSFPTEVMILERQQARIVPFVVDVPAGTPPGEYITALVIERTRALPSTGPLTLNQVDRSAIAVAIDVPGPRQPRLSIGVVGHKSIGGHSILTFAVNNAGNVHLWPAGRFLLRAAGEAAQAGEAVVMDVLYAGTGTLLEIPLSTPLAPGEYCAQLSLTDAATGAHDETDCLPFRIGPPASVGGSRSDAPWTLPGTNVAIPLETFSLGILAGMVLIGFALLLAGRRRRQRQTAASVPSGRQVKPEVTGARVGR